MAITPVFIFFFFCHSPTGTAGGEAAPRVSHGRAGQWPPAGVREQADGGIDRDAEPARAADQDVQGRDREDVQLQGKNQQRCLTR